MGSLKNVQSTFAFFCCFYILTFAHSRSLIVFSPGRVEVRQSWGWGVVCWGSSLKRSYARPQGRGEREKGKIRFQESQVSVTRLPCKIWFFSEKKKTLKNKMITLMMWLLTISKTQTSYNLPVIPPPILEEMLGLKIILILIIIYWVSQKKY